MSLVLPPVVALVIAKVCFKRLTDIGIKNLRVKRQFGANFGLGFLSPVGGALSFERSAVNPYNALESEQYGNSSQYDSDALYGEQYSRKDYNGGGLSYGGGQLAGTNLNVGLGLI